MTDDRGQYYEVNARNSEDMPYTAAVEHIFLSLIHLAFITAQHCAEKAFFFVSAVEKYDAENMIAVIAYRLEKSI